MYHLKFYRYIKYILLEKFFFFLNTPVVFKNSITTDDRLHLKLELLTTNRYDRFTP